jgi:hypothetical protein
MIQEKMNVLEKVGLSESNLSDKALSASFHSKVSPCLDTAFPDTGAVCLGHCLYRIQGKYVCVAFTIYRHHVCVLPSPDTQTVCVLQ